MVDEHTPHFHRPNNVNIVHAVEQASASLNQRIAVGLTNAVGTMICAYCFAALAIIGFPGFTATPAQYVQWLSQTFIQLVMLSVIMVGQRVLGRHQELQADETYQLAMKICADTETMITQLNKIIAAIDKLEHHEEPKL